jgi:hypothetical protein
VAEQDGRGSYNNAGRDPKRHCGHQAGQSGCDQDWAGGGQTCQCEASTYEGKRDHSERQHASELHDQNECVWRVAGVNIEHIDEAREIELCQRDRDRTCRPERCKSGCGDSVSGHLNSHREVA